jgi:pyruvate/2-oxoglutarate dehydrogenase complex dihydrolipoamide acyltransferase (E2) component
MLLDRDKLHSIDTFVQVKSLAEKARTGKLKPHEFQGGTFRSASLSDFKVTNVDCPLGGSNCRFCMEHVF